MYIFFGFDRQSMFAGHGEGAEVIQKWAPVDKGTSKWFKQWSRGHVV